ncbi:adenylosuccinate lyase [Candidatus Gracilibacteria bacterium]|nr:adenylosuccinate lyase [Candidatus Gracilibacteria bacterium]MCF7856031.1 adenylosuccinate lyase [Candidatus Gracilibacteria bacterium]MCF7896414.1 adenylosuccinate lyase [Candidatus Gracilibacteria bacterium]
MNLLSLSPLDGRYAAKLDPLREFFSEFALQKYRVAVELKYLAALGDEVKIQEVRKFSAAELKLIEKIIENFDEKDGAEIKKIEATTNHDVKAVEYFLQQKLTKTSLKNRIPFLHFALTSEDVNNLATAKMTANALKNVILPELKKVHAEILRRAKAWKKIPLLARTHGQPATPTTLGKEFFVFAKRLDRKIEQLKKQEIFGKLNGATGTFAAHQIAFPEVNWENFSRKFVRKLGLTPNLATTQIEPHDWIAETCDELRGANNILIDFSRDVWNYISLNYFKLKKKEGEVGSSTMPHKVNPIDFENAEGNFGIANSLLSFLSDKLPISRMQRDLTDSTVLRNLGVAVGHSFLGWRSLQTGISKLEVNKAKLLVALRDNPEVLAEAIQTILRKNGEPQAYEKLKKLTRGEKLSVERIRKFVTELKIPTADKKRLLELTPEKYVGIAIKLVK